MTVLDNTYPQLDLDWKLGKIPSEKECVALWNKYEMLPNIREHSRLVAEFARALAYRINEKFPYKVSEECAYVGGLLHDIAKTITIRDGGSHQDLGASIVRAETGNPLLASCVFHHVLWPWEEGILDLKKHITHVPLLIAYADKRVLHNTLVRLDKRFEDLLERYGRTEKIRENIRQNYKQAKCIEDTLATVLEFDLYACTLTSGRLVA